MRSHWTAPVGVLKESVDKLLAAAKVLDETVEPVVGFGFHSSAITGVEHDDLWLAMLKEVRHPQAVIVEHEGFVERKMGIMFGEVHQNVYVNEHVNEIVFRDLVDGKEQKTERAIVLRDHPLEIEVRERNIRSGFRVHSEMTKKIAKILMDGLVKSAKLTLQSSPTTVGLGIRSAPIHGASFDSLLTALELTIRQSWLVMDESVEINEEDGEITYSMGEVQRVAVIHKSPLRLEMYQRNRQDKVRIEWDLPYQVAKETMSKLVSMAKEIEEQHSDTVGYGMHTPPLECGH